MAKLINDIYLLIFIAIYGFNFFYFFRVLDLLFSLIFEGTREYTSSAWRR